MEKEVCVSAGFQVTPGCLFANSVKGTQLSAWILSPDLVPLGEGVLILTRRQLERIMAVD